MSEITLLQGDVRVKLPEVRDKSVHCVVTSPPYWGLRSYIPANSPLKSLEIGSEKTPELYVATILGVFVDIWRVLRDDGVCFLNLGDTCAFQGGSFDPKEWDNKQSTNLGSVEQSRRPPAGLKAKDIVGVPWMVAFALRSAGWYLRSDIIWDKVNPMPESVTDRPTKSHEYVFLLTKKPHYFYDYVAIMERSSENTHARVPGNVRPSKAQAEYEKNGDRAFRKTAGLLDYAKRKQAEAGSGIKNNDSFAEACSVMPPTRNKRDVWRISSVAYKGPHYATFPPKLAEPCILAGTSAKGCCADCGAPWERVVTKTTNSKSDYNGKNTFDKKSAARNVLASSKAARAAGGDHDNPFPTKETIGWQPTCECRGKLVREKRILPARMSKEDVGLWGADANGEYNGHSVKNHPDSIQDSSEVKRRIIENATKDREVWVWAYHSEIPLGQHPVVPCTVLDPFGGSGTTGQVALEHGRNAILIDLDPACIEQMKQRTNVTPGLALS